MSAFERPRSSLEGWRARGLLALGSPRAPARIIAVALALTSCALTLGLTADDYFHLAGVRPAPDLAELARRPWDLFAFVRADPASTLALMDKGVFPWWSDPECAIAFWRPLSSLTHWLDYWFWPAQPALMHLHSLLWFALLLAVTWRVYKSLSASPAIAGLSLFLYALDDARASAVGWLATRNLLIALSFGMLALAAHHRWRSQNDRHGRWLAPAALAVGLLAGESAVQAFAYLVAYAVFLDRASARERLLSLLPYALVLLCWRVPYSLLGYGVRGSGLYFDPGHEPLGFAGALAVRWPLLLLAQVGFPFSDTWDILPAFAPGAEPLLLALAVGTVAGFAWLLAPLWRNDARVRFWALGAMLAAVPVSAGPIDDRLLAGPGIGGAALMALLLAAWTERRYPSRGRLGSLALCGLFLLHVVVAPLLLPARTLAVDAFERLMARADLSIPRTPDVADKTIVALNPPADLFAVYFAPYRVGHGLPRPERLRWLATGISELAIERVDERSLRVRPALGYLSNTTQWMLRSPRRPLARDQKLAFGDATLEVTELTHDRRPAEVLVRFREPLESPALQFLQWHTHGYVPFTLPRIGQTVIVPAIDTKAALFGD